MNPKKQVQGTRGKGQRRFLFCALCFVLCAGSSPLISALEKTSPESRVPSPQRIVSLSTVVTEEIFLLEEGKRLVGRSFFCDRPPEAQEIPVVGNIVDADLEKIVLLEPDLVIVTPMIDPRAVTKMQALGLKVETFAPAKSFEDVNGTFLRLAGLLGKEQEAARIVNEGRKTVESLRRKIPKTESVSVFFEVGTDPLVTITRDSFLNDMIAFAGGKNIAADAPQARYSREKVLSQNPEVIIISSMGFDTERETEKKMWQRYPELRAVQEDRIAIVNSDLFCAPTPLSFVHALENLAQILHPVRE